MHFFMPLPHRSLRFFAALLLLFLIGGCEKAAQTAPDYFLNGVDWRQGGYALVIVTAEGTPMLVTQPDILQAHEQILLAEADPWLSFLPGKSNEQRALYLFQNRRLIKFQQERAYKHFDTGRLLEQAQMLEDKHSEAETQAPYLARQARLQAQENVWIYQQSEVQPFQHFFHVDLPTVAVFSGAHAPAEADKEAREYTLGRQLYTEIQADLERQFDSSRFDMSNVNRNLLQTTISPPMIHRRDNHFDGLLRDGDRNVLQPEGWTLYQYRLTVFCHPEMCPKLQQYDFNRYLAAHRSQTPQLQASLAQLAAKAEPPVSADQLIIEDYTDQARISRLHELVYGLSYFELPSMPSEHSGRAPE